jgi:ketosteroid isomerase-like protein
MPGSNVEIAKQAYEAMTEGGYEALLPLLDPEFEMVTTGEVASEPDTYRGAEGMRRYWASFYEVMDEIRVEAEEFIEVGDLVVIPSKLHATGRSTGIEASQSAVQVWQLRDGKALRVDFFSTREEAMAYARERAEA